MQCIQHYEINQDVPRHLVIVDTLNIWHLGLQPMITIPNQKHVMRKRFQIRMLQKEVLKLFVFIFPVTIPTHLVCFQKILLFFQVQ
jgi:hypothetical protein